MRDQREKALVYWGAMLPNMKKPPTFEQFTGYQPSRAERIKRWVEAWDKADASLRRH